MRVITCCLFFILLAGPIWAGVTSKYTKTEQSEAISMEQGDPEEPGGDWIRMRFPGFGGYELIYNGADARGWLDVKYGEEVSDLYSVTMNNAPGHFPYKANEVVEWRGIEEGGEFRPYALIYRIGADDPESGKTRTRLLVFHLKDGKAVFAGFAQGAGEGEQSREIADRNRP